MDTRPVWRSELFISLVLLSLLGVAVLSFDLRGHAYSARFEAGNVVLSRRTPSGDRRYPDSIQVYRLGKTGFRYTKEP